MACAGLSLPCCAGRPARVLHSPITSFSIAEDSPSSGGTDPSAGVVVVSPPGRVCNGMVPGSGVGGAAYATSSGADAAARVVVVGIDAPFGMGGVVGPLAGEVVTPASVCIGTNAVSLCRVYDAADLSPAGVVVVSPPVLVCMNVVSPSDVGYSPPGIDTALPSLAISVVDTDPGVHGIGSDPSSGVTAPICFAAYVGDTASSSSSVES